MKVVLSADTVALLSRTVLALKDGTRTKKALPQWLPNGEPITELKHLAAVLSIDERTAAFVVLDSYRPPTGLLAEAKDIVRTPEGAIKYGQPIGTVITRDKQSWAKRIFTAALAGGMTLSFLTGVEPDHGYAVASRGDNQEIPDDVFFSSQQRGISELRKWVIAHKDKFADNPSAHLGIWHDEDHHEVVLDVSYVIEDRDEAIRLGQQNNQQAIWDIANFDEIDTGGTGDRQEKGYGRQGLSYATTKADRRHDRRRTRRLAENGMGSHGQGTSQRQLKDVFAADRTISTATIVSGAVAAPFATLGVVTRHPRRIRLRNRRRIRKARQ